MSEEVEKKELEKLERAAEAAEEPEKIEEEAAKPEKELPEKTSPFWFVPYLIAAALAGAGILLLEWKPSLFHPSLGVKIHRYLLGALAVTGVLALERALEVYAIGRLRSAVSRYNLKRIVRL